MMNVLTYISFAVIGFMCCFVLGGILYWFWCEAFDR